MTFGDLSENQQKALLKNKQQVGEALETVQAVAIKSLSRSKKTSVLDVSRLPSILNIRDNTKPAR